MSSGRSLNLRAQRVNALAVLVYGASLFYGCAAGREDSPSGGPPIDASSEMPGIDGSTPDATPDSATPPDTSVPGEASPAASDSSGPEASAPEAGDDSTAPDTSIPDTAIPDTYVADTSVPETSTTTCVASPSGGTLPFVVDTAGIYVTSGYEGAVAAITMAFDPTCGGNRSSPGASGNCHPVTYTPPPPGSTAPNWSGVLWQHPTNNWGNLGPGYAIPAGATKVSFWARGQLGGEVVTFYAGFDVTPSPTAPCFDSVTGSLKKTLTTPWTHYTMPLTGQYPSGIISPFGYVVSVADQPLIDGGPPTSVAFYIDDIQWQP
jgi:hypothetical protein